MDAKLRPVHASPQTSLLLLVGRSRLLLLLHGTWSHLTNNLNSNIREGASDKTLFGTEVLFFLSDRIGRLQRCFLRSPLTSSALTISFRDCFFMHGDAVLTNPVQIWKTTSHTMSVVALCPCRTSTQSTNSTDFSLTMRRMSIHSIIGLKLEI